jgi:predicted RNase H-like nuclease
MLAGPARSRVFATPPRAIVDDERRAGDAGLQALSRTLWGRGVSAQALALRPRIREIDALVRSDPRARTALHEVHPEVSLRLLAGADAPSKHTYAGIRFRIRALVRVFGASVDVLAEHPPAGVGTDDVLDALLALWSAERIAAGSAQIFGGDVDEHGIRMAIHA